MTTAHAADTLRSAPAASGAGLAVRIYQALRGAGFDDADAGCATAAILPVVAPDGTAPPRPAAGPSSPPPGPRPDTAYRKNPDGTETITVKRLCNGCGRTLGDATEDELGAATAGRPLPDVTVECGCAAG